MNDELKDAIKSKIDELSFAHYESNVEGLIIIVATKGNFQVLNAYSNFQHGVLNCGLDVAKQEMLDNIRKSSTRT